MQTIKAYAKINWSLYITGVRSDGYHLLNSLMAKIDLADELSFARSSSPGVDFVCTNQPTLNDSNNLVVRAAQKLLPAGAGVALRLHKNIPVGAGLGGGSSDAAATLLAMQQLFNLTLRADAMVELAGSLGADVAFFLGTHQWAQVSDIGTVVQPLPSPTPKALVLVYPGFMVSTASAYQAFRQQQKVNPLTLSGSNDKRKRQSDGRDVSWMSPSQMAQLLHNDLEPVVQASHPQIADVKRSLRELGAIATLMSGSGSSVFGLYADMSAASQVAAVIRQRDGVWCQAVETLSA